MLSELTTSQFQQSDGFGTGRLDQGVRSEGLQPSGWRQDIKSGQDRTFSRQPKVQVLWPHEAFDTVLGKKHYSFNNLTFPALMGGMLNAITDDQQFRDCPPKIIGMLRHASLLAHAESVVNDTKTTQDFHRSILKHVESGDLTWTEETRTTYELLKAHFLAGVRQNSPNQQPRQQGKEQKHDKSFRTKKNKAGVIVCKEYGDGTCQEPGDHGKDKQHVCYHCLVQRETRAIHPRKECPEPKL